MIAFCGGVIVLILIALFGIAHWPAKQQDQYMTMIDTYYDGQLKSDNVCRKRAGHHDSNRATRYLEPLDDKDAWRNQNRYDCDPHRN